MVSINESPRSYNFGAKKKDPVGHDGVFLNRSLHAIARDLIQQEMKTLYVYIRIYICCFIHI